MKRSAGMLMAVVTFGVLLGSSLTVRAQQAAEESSSRATNRNSVTKQMRNLSASAGTAARPSPSAPVVNPNEYIVGEADVLHINVWREAELTGNVVVRPDGKISVPLLSEVKVAGMTPVQIEQVLSERLKALLVSPQVTVTVMEIRSKAVFITGEVARAGEYPLVTPIRVLQLIARAGGLSPYASRKNIYVLRNLDGRQQRFPFDYSSVVRGKNADQDIELRPGDTVVVP